MYTNQSLHRMTEVPVESVVLESEVFVAARERVCEREKRVPR